MSDSIVHRFALTAMLLAACGCGGGPTAPPPPPPIPQLTITCPGVVDAHSENGQPIPVSFAPPIVTGGQLPVNVTCSIASGTPFTVGRTPVSCTASDARGISARCEFIVSVGGPPRLKGTRFVAFGDSITAGKFSPPLAVVESQFAYTLTLEFLLRERYRFQSPQVINEGISGEIAHINGRTRLPAVLAAHRPDVLLLMEGTNDLLTDSGIEAAITALREMIQHAKQQGVAVALATVAPQRSGGSRPPGVAERVPLLNDQIRQLAAAEGVVLVDVYNAMKDDIRGLIGVDDLHPTPRGFEVIAQTFFEAIRTNFEEVPPGTAFRR